MTSAATVQKGLVLSSFLCLLVTPLYSCYIAGNPAKLQGERTVGNLWNSKLNARPSMTQPTPYWPLVFLDLTLGCLMPFFVEGTYSQKKDANPIFIDRESSWLNIHGMQTLCFLGLGRTTNAWGKISVCVLFSCHVQGQSCQSSPLTVSVLKKLVQIGKSKRTCLATCMLHLVKTCRWYS